MNAGGLLVNCCPHSLRENSETISSSLLGIGGSPALKTIDLFFALGMSIFTRRRTRHKLIPAAVAKLTSHLQSLCLFCYLALVCMDSSREVCVWCGGGWG